MTQRDPARLVVLISGTGRNLQALIDAAAAGWLGAKIVRVISNRADAYGLQRAQRAGISTQVLPTASHADRDSYDADLAAAVQAADPDMVALAGFMRILSSGFVQQFAGRLVNIHPSLLPAYRGLNTHQRILDAGETRHGASVHFVSEALDAGPTILQGSVAVRRHDNTDSLAQRVMQRIETRIYPQAVALLAAGRVGLDGASVTLDDKQLEGPIHVDCD